jgi:hypothetical protein
VLGDVGHGQWVLREHRTRVVARFAQPPATPRSFGRTLCSPRLAVRPIPREVSIPKMLRPKFLYHHPPLGRLCRAAWHRAREMIAAASPAGGEIRPGMIAVVQTAGCDLGWHPHVHPLVTRGGWDRAGQCVPVPFVDGETAALMVRHKAILFLKAEGLLSEERARLLLSWRHTGLQGHRDTDAGQDTQPPPNPRRFGPMHGQPASRSPPPP